MLTEVMVAVAISSIVLAVVAAFAFYSARSFAAIGNYVDLDGTSRQAVDVMTKEIRQTKALFDYKTNSLTFTDYDDKQLQFNWDTTRRELTSFQPQPSHEPHVRGCRGHDIDRSRSRRSNPLLCRITAPRISGSRSGLAI